jgi:hypothetical protein
MTTETSSSASGGDELAVPLTGEGDSCYLCENDATHVGQIAAGPFTSEVGLCEGCYLREVAEVPTSIDRTGTWNHKKIRYDDGSICFTYETDEGYYSVIKDSFFGIWDVDGPFDLPNAHVCGGTSVTDVSPTAIPGAAGNTVEITGVEVLPARDCSSDSFSAICPECETVSEQPTENEAWAVAEGHNESFHGGEAVAGIPENQIAE